MIEIGLVLPTRETIMRGSDDPGPLLELAERADGIGLDSVWVGDSLFASARFEPLTLLGALAARTRTVEIGSAVMIPTLRHPVVLAHSLATVDRIAAGRLRLGFGAGWLQQEFDVVGVPFDERVGRTAETIRICRALWAGESSFDGRYWSFADVEIRPRPARAGGPPIWLGGSGPMALRTAGRLADGWIPTSPTPESFAEGWQLVRESASAAGRSVEDLTAAAYLTINLDPSGRDEVERYAQDYYGLPFEVMQQVQGYYVGAPDGAVEWLRGYVDAGVTYLVVRFAADSPERHLDLALKEVFPAVREIGS